MPSDDELAGAEAEATSSDDLDAADVTTAGSKAGGPGALEVVAGTTTLRGTTL